MTQSTIKTLLPSPVFPSLAAYKIRAHRKANKLSAAKLADELGVSQPSILYWETGKRVAGHSMQGVLQERGICQPNDWHLPAPVSAAA